MITFGSGTSSAETAALAGREAATRALAMATATASPASPKVAIVFTSASYPDAEAAARAVRDVVGDVQIIGGTAGACIFDGERSVRKGVSVVLLGGDGLEVEARIARLGSSQLVEAVPAAEHIAREADVAAKQGLAHFACLVFAPGLVVDGEALVAAVRKGAGARAQLAGALTGDDLTFDRAQVFFGDELHSDCVVIAGLFTRAPVGIAARHGWSAVGPTRQVTRADGTYLVEIDGRPAADVWIEDARAAGAEIPQERSEIALYLANYYEIGIADRSAPRIAAIQGGLRELVARAPVSIREDGAVLLSASIGEGSRIRVMHATSEDILRASSEAAAAAAAQAGHRVAGALVLACSSRLACLGDSFSTEPANIRRAVEAPVGGACVFGEVARNVRDTDAFFNSTAVVVAFGA